jgi:hypothetical protein
MPLRLEDIPDFVETVLDEYEKKGYVDLTIDPRQKVAPKLVNKKVRNWKGGKQVDWKLKVAEAGNARTTGLFDTDRSNRVSMVDSGQCPWAFYTTNFIYDVQEEEFGSDNPNVVIDYLEMQNHDMYEGFWKLLETHLWTAPTTSTQNPRQMFGLPFWIQKNGATAQGALNGGNPTGFSAGAGSIDSNTYSQWKNWTFSHDGTVTEQGFIERVVEAMDKCQFVAAHAYPELGGSNKEQRFGLYSTYRMKKGLRRFLRSQNDNLGKDAAEMHKGNPIINGNEVEEVPYLTDNVSADDGTASNGDDPIYGVDWKTMEFFRKRNWWMKRHAPIRAAGSHNVYEVHMDSHIQLCCNNRRRNFVGHYGTVS